jgi:hypothetical protein
VLASKYSSPMFRPPTIVIWLSAVIDLLCMRRLTREKSEIIQSALADREEMGLKSRTSMFGCASSSSSVRSSGDAPTSSMSSRTRTPRSAARITAPISSLPTVSFVPAVVLQVEAALGEIDEGEARKERIGTVGYQVDARRPVQLGHPAGRHSPERRRVGGISERRRGAACVRLRK